MLHANISISECVNEFEGIVIMDQLQEAKMIRKEQCYWRLHKDNALRY